MTPAEVIEQAVDEMLRATVPAHLRRRIGIASARGWFRDHLKTYKDEQAQFPDQPLLPWSNVIGYDDDWNEAFFVILVLYDERVELFCGTGPWPDVRRFSEGDADDFPAAQLHREWSARFTVPCPPLVLGKTVVGEWLGRGW